MQNFNMPIVRSQLPQEQVFKPLPEGKYVAMITKAEIKDTKALTGQYINFKYVIVDGQHKGRSFFDNVNISNPNQEAVDIGLARLNTVLTIGGVDVLQNTQQLINITVLATIGFSDEIRNGERQNKVLRLESPTQQVSQAPQAQPVQQQAPQSWQQKPVQQWQSQPPVTPTIQSTQQMLNDEIPFN